MLVKVLGLYTVLNWRNYDHWNKRSCLVIVNKCNLFHSYLVKKTLSFDFWGILETSLNWFKSEKYLSFSDIFYKKDCAYMCQSVCCLFLSVWRTFFNEDNHKRSRSQLPSLIFQCQRFLSEQIVNPCL